MFMSDTPHEQRLDVIQAGRALAALAVVFFHAETIIGAQGGGLSDATLFGYGERGVDFFFVLSGFIIVYAHGSDTPSTASFRSYLSKRLIRLYPLLWLVAGGTLALNLILDGQVPTLEKALTSLTLMPSLEWPSPGVSWTLRHEIIFYLIFGLCLLHRGVGQGALALWFALCFGQALWLWQGGGVTGLAAFFLSPLNIDFAFGILAALLAGRIRARGQEGVVLIAGLGAVLAVGLAHALTQGSMRLALTYTQVAAVHWDLLFGAAFGLLVFALSKADRILTVPRWLLFLGAASYAIYLVHVSVMGLMARFIVPLLGRDFIGSLASYGALIALVIAVSALIHIWFERPVTAGLRRRMVRS